MSYKIERIEKSDFDKIIDAWSFAFGNSDSERALEFARENLDMALGVYTDGNLESVAAIIDFDMHLGGRFVKCAGVTGVATFPSHRRQQLVKKAIAELIRLANEKKYPVSALWPFSYPFYERMGWSVTDLQYIVEVETRAIKRAGDSRKYQRIGAGELESLMERHERWIGQYNCSLRRPEHRWKAFLASSWRNKGDCRLFIHDDGYMVWHLPKERPAQLKVTEWAYMSDAAFLDGLALLSQMDSQFQSIVWRASEIERLLKLGVPEPRPKIEMNTGMMTRVLNVSEFNGLIPGGLGDLEINDPLCVSGTSSSAGAVGPGELLQLVTGFWKKPPDTIPQSVSARLNGVLADRPAYSVEFY